MKKKELYESPSVEVVSVRIEKGFATSTNQINGYADDGEAGMLLQGDTYNF